MEGVTLEVVGGVCDDDCLRSVVFCNVDDNDLIVLVFEDRPAAVLVSTVVGGAVLENEVDMTVVEGCCDDGRMFVDDDRLMLFVEVCCVGVKMFVDD